MSTKGMVDSPSTLSPLLSELWLACYFSNARRLHCRLADSERNGARYFRNSTVYEKQKITRTRRVANNV